MKSILILLLFISSLALSFAGEENHCHCDCHHDDEEHSCSSHKWKRVQTYGEGPTFIGAHTMVEYQESLYVFGGFLEDFELGIDIFYNNLWQWRSIDKTWILLDNGTGPVPRAFQGASTSTVNSDMYMYGGVTYLQQNQTFSNIVIFGDFWAWNFPTNTWTEVTPLNAGPGLRGDMGMAYLNGKVYLFGGIANQFFTDRNDLWAYDIATNTWTNLIPDGQPGSPPPRHSTQFRSSTFDNKIYLYGGEVTATAFGTLEDTWVYDPALNTWTNITPPDNLNLDPAVNNFQGSTIVGTKFTIFGGESDQDNFGAPGLICGAPFSVAATQQPTNNTWVFDIRPTQRRWVQLFPNQFKLPPALKRHTAEHIGECFYIFGGWNFPACPPGQVWNNDIWVFKIKSEAASQ